jgi:hypothetical protein
MYENRTMKSTEFVPRWKEEAEVGDGGGRFDGSTLHVYMET